MNPSSGLPRASVLPPIPSARDRAFLESLQSFIRKEKESLLSGGQYDAEQRCIMYSHVFDKVIGHTSGYKPILTTIKQEYDEIINAIKRGRREEVLLHRKLRTLASEPATMMYYRKRASELRERIELIERNSNEIERQIQRLRDERRVSGTDPEKPGTAENLMDPAQPIPGMKIEDSLDMEALTKYRQHLEERRQALKDAIKTRYVPIHLKEELDEKLALALQEKEEEEFINNKLILGYGKRRIVADAISSWVKSDKCISLEEALSLAIAKEDQLKDDVIPADVFDDTDPGKITEGKSLLEYVERFNDLLLSGQYKAAATHAAHSPRGILRNVETMEKFKAAEDRDGQVFPLLLFFEALFGSSSLTKHPINGILTLEGVKCALSRDKVDLVVHWVTQQRITFSEALGDFIKEYGDSEPFHESTCLALAQLIYRKCCNAQKAALCMCLQDQVQGALDYTYQYKRFSLDDYLFLLKNCPTAELIHGLTREWNGKPAALSVGQAVLSLIYTDHKEYGFQLLENIHSCGDRALEQVILNDVACTLEGWVEIAAECLNNGYRQLSERIRSIVTSQDGVVEISSKDEDAKIMEHVFM
uniref:Clathrin heavy chain linker domain-containing protein 1 n=1 Tax=Leptobrachium leishanense TaxID=445787 RepID=A0A8C5PPK4_9ANUR